MKVAIISAHFAEYIIRYVAASPNAISFFIGLDKKGYHSELGNRHNLRRGKGSLNLIDFKSPLQVLGLIRKIVAFKPDILHLHEANGLGKAITILLIALVLRGRTQLWLTVHDPVAHSGSDAAIERKIRPLRIATRRLANRLVVHGKFCKTSLTALPYINPDKVLTSSHGVILSSEHPSPYEPRRFLMFGRMEYYKGLETLIEAVEMLEAEGLKFRVRLMGGGNEVQRLYARLRESQIFELDDTFIPPEQLIEEICAASCILMPYLDATQSAVLSAAFGNARPVICTNVGGLPDLAIDGENALLFEARDAQGLAQCIRRLIDDPPLLARLMEGAKRTADTRLNWDVITAGAYTE